MQPGERQIGERIEPASGGRKAQAFRKVLRQLPAGQTVEVIVSGTIPADGAHDLAHVQIVLANGQTITTHAENIRGMVYEEPIEDPELPTAPGDPRPSRSRKDETQAP